MGGRHVRSERHRQTCAGGQCWNGVWTVYLCVMEVNSSGRRHRTMFCARFVDDLEDRAVECPPPTVMLRGHCHRRGTAFHRPISALHLQSISVLLTFFFGPCPELLTRFRLLITSVLRLIGRDLPCSFRNSPQALQSTEPISSRRHRGVVEVVQFWHTGCNRPRSLSVNVAMVCILMR